MATPKGAKPPVNAPQSGATPQGLLVGLSKGLGKSAGGSPIATMLDDPNRVQAGKWYAPFGSELLAEAAGLVALPSGKLVLLEGKSGSGKSTLALTMAAAAQKGCFSADDYAAYVKGDAVELTPAWVFGIDVERAFDATYSTAIGLDVANFVAVDAITVEDIFRRIADIILSARTGIVHVTEPGKVQKPEPSFGKQAPYSGPLFIIVDAIGRAPTDKELEAPVGHSIVQAGAKTITSEVRRILHLIATYDVHLLVVNHTYTSVDMRTGVAREVPYGGEALLYEAAMRMNFRNSGVVAGENDEDLGLNSRITFYKNKISGTVSTTLDVTILRSCGLYELGMMLQREMAGGVLKAKGGGWVDFVHNEVPIKLQGFNQVLKWFEANGGVETLKQIKRAAV